MSVSQALKTTEFGILPADWQLKPVGELSQIFTGNTPPPSDKRNYGDVYMFVSPVDLGTHKYIKNTSKYLSEAGWAIARKFPKDSILFVCIGSTIGKCGIAIAEFSSNQQINVVVSNNTICPNFLYYALSNVSHKIRVQASEQAVPLVNKSQFSATILPIPPTKVEQEAIAEALSDADALIESLEQLIEKKRRIKQGAIQELLTGRQRLKGFTATWETDFVENICEITTGGKNTQDKIDDGTYPFFVRSQTVERINSFSYDGEAVLTAGDGVGTGKVFHYFKGRFDVHQRVYRMAEFSSRVSGYFFYLYFSSHFYERIMQMTAKSSVDSVRREMIAKMKIQLPPRHEQDAIVEFLVDLDSEIKFLDDRISKTKILKNAMMQQLLTGKIRLV